MHIGFDIKNSDFVVRLDGALSTRETLLEWEPHARIGIVVDRPYGALNASTLLFLAGTAFYDANLRRRKHPLYPDMYLLHVGGPWGSHMPFDFFPSRKEVMVAPDAREVLRAINQIGITHLLIPDREKQAIEHRFKEPEEAHDRISKVFVYQSVGPLAGADVAITANVGAVAPSIHNTLNPRSFLDMIETTIAQDTRSSREAGLRTVDPDEMRLVLPGQRARSTEVCNDDPERLRLLARIRTAEAEGQLTEHFRRETVKNALEMLR